MSMTIDRRLRQLEEMRHRGANGIVIVRHAADLANLPPATGSGVRLVIIGLDVPGCLPAASAEVRP